MERKTGFSTASLALALLCAAHAHAGAPRAGPPAPVNGDFDAIAASHVIHRNPADLPPHPAFKADPRTLTLAVGANRITVLDDTLAPVAHIATHGIVGAPAFSPDGRVIYWASADGWVSQFDLATLTPIARIRAGATPRSLAASRNGRYLMVVNTAPATLVALDARDLSLVKVTPGVDKNGRPSGFSAVVDASRRNAFVVALTDAPELWEIPYDGRPVYKGLVHDYRLKEAIAEPGPLPARVIALDAPLANFAFAPAHDVIIGFPRDTAHGHIVHLGVGRRIVDLPLVGSAPCPAMPAWERHTNGNPQRLIALRSDAGVAVVDTKNWQPIARLRTSGPGCLMRGHDRSPYLWLDASTGSIDLLDRERLEVVATLQPGGRVVDIAFGRDGRHALVAVDGALVVFDALTRAEIKRLPLDASAGLYNVWNTSPPPADTRR